MLGWLAHWLARWLADSRIQRILKELVGIAKNRVTAYIMLRRVRSCQRRREAGESSIVATQKSSDSSLKIEVRIF